MIQIQVISDLHIWALKGTFQQFNTTGELQIFLIDPKTDRQYTSGNIATTSQTLNTQLQQGLSNEAFFGGV